jgi:hypothetical protein
MSRIGKISQRVLMGVLLFAGAAIASSAAFGQGAQQPASPGYNRDEYDKWMACRNEKVPEQKVRCLDEFVAKNASAATALAPYLASDYLYAYFAVKDWPKTIEAADKLLAFGEKIDPKDQLNARLVRAQAYIGGAAQMQTPDKLNAARDSARQALKDVDARKKPDAESQADFDKENKSLIGIFESVIAATSEGLKDNAGIIDGYKTLATLDPTEPSYWYKIGRAELSMTPPQTMDAFWAIARSVSLKGPNEAQIKDYLKKLVANYQQAACDNLVDDEVNQMITLAGGSPDRPATFTLYSSDDLNKARTDTANFIPYLREGGDHGKLMWLAVCGLEYPEIVTKLIAIDTPEGAPIVMHTFTGVTGDETKDGTVADMEVKLDGSQPEAKRLVVNDELRFGATLSGYDQAPTFMLHWDKGKINPEDIPAETGKKPAPKKKPGGVK